MEEGLRPLMTVKTRVAAVRRLPAGTPVSYGRTHTLDHDATLAVINRGYGDGLHRQCSKGLQVYLAGEKAPEVGRV